MVSALGYVTVDLPMDEREREREDLSVSDFFFLSFFPLFNREIGIGDGLSRHGGGNRRDLRLGFAKEH